MKSKSPHDRAASTRVDVGFGDAVTPAPEETSYPVLLADMPSPRLRVYARETAIAEKVEAMVTLGFGNTRMKDFFDIWYLARDFEFDEATFGAAIRATSPGGRRRCRTRHRSR